ncbi:pickpocket protein 28-like isoform X1 [Diabrotica virgifera virgifera]|uniref:Pickpocket protein 28-like n=1 Tax=Diabrotica virgifera virgifera TaxID=50390 RepID=A0ABM5IZF7_DIAVI|nr:pickpocket protein 28-like isoform X1 [Diabrotica virgifera virgifera]
MSYRFRRYCRDYCEHSSITGFNYVAEERSKTERILWLILIAVALSLSIYFINEQYNKYEENPFIVSFATRDTPIYEIPFPAVTICPFAKFNRSIFNYTNVVHRLWDNLTISNYELETAQYMSLLCSEGLIDDYKFPKNYTFTENFYNRLDELETTGQLIKSFGCIYMGTLQNCSNIFSPIILDGGVCFTFNMLNRDEIYKPDVFQFYDSLEPKSEWTNDEGYRPSSGKDVYPRRALQSGADNALNLIFIELSQDTDYLCCEDVGYTITVHAPNAIPQTRKDFFILPLDSASHIMLNPELMTTSKVVKAYKTEDRKCYFAEERKLKYFVTYTQENCFLECVTNYTLDKCLCVNFFMPHDNTTEICGNSNFRCLSEAEREIKILEINTDPKGFNTHCHCLPLCTQLHYQAITSTYNWKWKEYFLANKKLQRMFNYTDNGLNAVHFSSLKIFFKSEQFLSHEKNELYGIFDFISNFGGLLGLFTGFSLLTLAEVIYYLSLRLWCNKRLYNDVSGPSDDAEPKTNINNLRDLMELGY